MPYRKYRNMPCEIDGFKFDSQAEGRRYNELKLLVKVGMITDLELHPTYELQAKYVNGAGRKIQALSYEADFRYIEIFTGNVIVEDVKRKETATVQYKIKKKLFEKVFYPLIVTEVDA